MLPTERRRSHSRGSLRIVSGLAENTNSIFCDGSSESETGIRKLAGLPIKEKSNLRIARNPGVKLCAVICPTSRLFAHLANFSLANRTKNPDTDAISSQRLLITLVSPIAK